MSDGLEWLICDEPCKVMDARSGCHCAKARDEIERLKAEVARARVREQELADEANRLLDEVKASDKKVFYLTAEVERKDAALNILQAAMTAKKPIPMPFKVAIIEARAALTPAEEKTDV